MPLPPIPRTRLVPGFGWYCSSLRGASYQPSLSGIRDAVSARGVQLNGPKADGKVIVLNWSFTDVGEKYVLTLENSTLSYMAKQQAASADATLVLARATLDAINLGKTTFDKEIAAGKIEGDGRKIAELFSLLDTFTGNFNIVTP